MAYSRRPPSSVSAPPPPTLLCHHHRLPILLLLLFLFLDGPQHFCVAADVPMPTVQLGDAAADVEPEASENTTAKTLMPPEPTGEDGAAVSTAYFNQKTYTIKEFHDLVQGLNIDIRNGFKKVEEESVRLSEAVDRLDGRLGKLEGWLDWKWLDRGLGSWPCLLLTGMALLLLAIALLVLCNTLLIKRVLGGAAAATAAAAAATVASAGGGASARKEKLGKNEQREMVSLVKESV